MREAQMYRTILVPLDGSRAAEHALPLAISIARRAGATLQLAHVHDAARPMFLHTVPYCDDQHDAEHRAYERAYLDDLASRLTQHHKLTITTTLLDGSAADTIALYALASCVDLVVLTTHGRSTPTQPHLGCVTAELMRWAPTPLLLIRPQATAPDFTHEPVCRQMLVLLDGSAQSERQLAHAIALGTLWWAEYTLLYVIDPPCPRCTGPYLGSDQQALEQQCSQAWRYLERIAARLTAEALRVHIHVVVGEPTSALLDYMRAGRRLLVMQTPARAGQDAQHLLGIGDRSGA
jgi:nucleotide-binding universal stress UspA family protein